MNYELSKQLKDTGFPQGDIFPLGDSGRYALSKRGFDPDIYIYIPTLSELIEACGDKFYQLTNGQAGFIAFSYPEFGEHYGEGKTPEEAVAKLWLALNAVGERSESAANDD